MGQFNSAAFGRRGPTTKGGESRGAVRDSTSQGGAVGQFQLWRPALGVGEFGPAVPARPRIHANVLFHLGSA
jgi:hypothetical protein